MQDFFRILISVESQSWALRHWSLDRPLRATLELAFMSGARNCSKKIRFAIPSQWLEAQAALYAKKIAPKDRKTKQSDLATALEAWKAGFLYANASRRRAARLERPTPAPNHAQTQRLLPAPRTRSKKKKRLS